MYLHYSIGPVIIQIYNTNICYKTSVIGRLHRPNLYSLPMAFKHIQIGGVIMEQHLSQYKIFYAVA